MKRPSQGAVERPVAEARQHVAEIAGQLAVLIDRLQGVAASLPATTEWDDMLEHRIPCDVATELVVAIECTLPGLGAALETLRKAATVSDEDLRREFQQQAASEPIGPDHRC